MYLACSSSSWQDSARARQLGPRSFSRSLLFVVAVMMMRGLGFAQTTTTCTATATAYIQNDAAAGTNQNGGTATSMLVQNDSTGAVTLHASDDMYVQNGTYASTNFSGATNLTVKDSPAGSLGRFAYLKFDLSNVTTSSVSSAILTLTVTSKDAGSISSQIYGITTNTWSGSSGTWSVGSPNHDTGTATYAVTGSPTLIANYTVTSDGALTIDVTSFVNSQLAASVKTVSFLLANSANLAVNYSSRVGTAPESLAIVHAPTGRMSYMIFDSSSYTAATVKSAKVRVYANAIAGPSTLVGLYGLPFTTANTTWSETGVTWNSGLANYIDPKNYVVANAAPSIPVYDSAGHTLIDIEPSASLAYSSFNVPYIVGWLSPIDLTDKIKTLLILGATKFTLIIAAPAGTANANYSSRETGTGAAQAPNLTFTWTGGSPGSFTVKATADTYVQNGTSAASSFGGSTSLSVGNSGTNFSRITYLSFDCSGVQPHGAITNINAAQLNLYLQSSVSGATITNQVYLSTAPWATTWSDVTNVPTWDTSHNHDTITTGTYTISEAGLVFNALSSYRQVASAATYYDFDVTDFMNAQRRSSHTTMCFGLAGLTANDGSIVSFDSRHGTNPPQLIIEGNTLSDNLTTLSTTEPSTSALTFTVQPYGSTPNGLVFQQEALTTFDGYQYTIYYNSDRYVCLARRPSGGSTWQTITFDSTGAQSTYFPYFDAHMVPVLGICPNDGTIHISWGMHATPLNYMVSVAGVATNPTTVTWGKSLFGNVLNTFDGTTSMPSITYPRFITEPNGNLLFRARYKTSGDGNGFLYEYTVPTGGGAGSWANVGVYDWGINGSTYTGLVSTSSTRNAYPEAVLFDSSGRLHTSFSWREGTGATEHDICYMYSDDYGRHWLNTSGGAVGQADSSATAATTTYANEVYLNSTGLGIDSSVKDNLNLYNDGGLNIDPAGRVHIMSLYQQPNVPQRLFNHHWRDTSGTWHVVALPFSAAGRPKLLSNSSTIYMVFTRDNQLKIAKATLANNYTDWQIIHTEGSTSEYYFGEPLVDYARWASSGILSIFCPEIGSGLPLGTTNGHIRVIEYQVN